jgi:hypothetical protein
MNKIIKLILTAQIFLLLSTLSYGESQYSLKDVSPKIFLIYKTPLKSTKEIGGHAKKHIPLLRKSALENNLKISGKIHHFYYSDKNESFLELGVPIAEKTKYTGAYKIVKKDSYKCISSMHKGPISGIGGSWNRLHTHANKSNELRSWKSCEIYKTDLTNLMHTDTRIELHQYILDKSKLKNECVVSYLAPKANAIMVGIKVGDVISKYEKTKISNSKDLIKAIKENKKSESDIAIVIKRKTELLTFKVKPGKLGVALSNR